LLLQGPQWITQVPFAVFVAIHVHIFDGGLIVDLFVCTGKSHSIARQNVCYVQYILFK